MKFKKKKPEGDSGEERDGDSGEEGDNSGDEGNIPPDFIPQPGISKQCKEISEKISNLGRSLKRKTKNQDKTEVAAAKKSRTTQDPVPAQSEGGPSKGDAGPSEDETH